MSDSILARIPVVGGLGYIERVRRVPSAFTAVLQAEPDNRYFPQAVAVLVNGEKVGYLAPEVAPGYFTRVTDSTTPVRCAGRRARHADHEQSGVELLLDCTALG
jgi:hypothetical protein